MKPEQLTTSTVLHSRTDSKVTRTIEDFRPAEGNNRPYRQWLINGQWLNYSQVDARYFLKGKPRVKNTPTTFKSPSHEALHKTA